MVAKTELTGTYSSGVTIDGVTIGSPLTIDSTATITAGSNRGVYSHSVATVSNAGVITAGEAGIYLGAGGAVSNSGTISGGGFTDGVYINNGTGSVTNLAGGVISGPTGVAGARGTSFTVENTGTIIGKVALGDANNLLIIDPGAVFSGTVQAYDIGGYGHNLLELKAGATGGTISGLGTQYIGFGTVTIDAGASWDVAGTNAGLAKSITTIQGFDAGDRLDITDLAFSAGDTVADDGTNLVIKDAGGTTLETIKLPGTFTADTFNLLSDGHSGTFVEEDGVACYCRGTLILTSRGEVAVEELKIGDLLVTHWGAKRPIRWIGTRAYDGRFAAGNKDVLPVRIAAGALGDNVPRRDLWVSPLHAMFIDGVLVPAQALANGNSITQAKSVDKVEYFHLELDSHEVIIAEGALSETFLDDNSRGMFNNAVEYSRRYPNARRKPAEYCAPIIEDGPELEVIRRDIAARGVGLREAA